MKLTIDTDNLKLRPRKNKSVSQKRRETARLLAWREKKRVEKDSFARATSAATPSIPAFTTFSGSITCEKKKKVAETELSPQSCQGIPQVDGEGGEGGEGGEESLGVAELSPPSCQGIPHVDGEGEEESLAEAEPSPPSRENMPQADGDGGEESLVESCAKSSTSIPTGYPTVGWRMWI